MADEIAVPGVVSRARSWSARLALIDEGGEHRFAALEATAAVVARTLLAGREDLAEARVAMLVPPGRDHVVIQWGIWRAGGVVVPLAIDHPAPELAGLIEDARPELVVAAPGFEAIARDASPAAPVVSSMGLVGGAAVDAGLPELTPGRRALMIYTSGTTGRPKGVVTTHAIIAAQVRTLVRAWEWSSRDRILHVLPLHHVHGLINALACALWSGACCEFHSPGDAPGIWNRLASGQVSVFMAVPTLYARLITIWEDANDADRSRWSAGARGLRLMVSGSAALPGATLARWEAITGHRLLERYGMTEIGMALGNPLQGERRPGTVGQPFPGVEARLAAADGGPAIPGGDAASRSGEIQVRGEQVFLEYWQRPEETRAAFTDDGWFRTGDEGEIVDGYWRIVGRRSIDIIKTGGYKVSALEIEETLRSHQGIAEVAVVGVADPEWGERVCAVIVPLAGHQLPREALRDWCKERMAPYKVPKELAVIDALPRNAMGKVLKVPLRALFQAGSGAAVAAT